LRSLDDRDLLALIAGGDSEALGVIYDRHIGSVWRLALMSCRDESAAERVVFNTFLDLWREPYANGSQPPVVRLLARVRALCSSRGGTVTSA
jgi:DNA-directed RNA polymerase specialized sigma24 family protein